MRPIKFLLNALVGLSFVALAITAPAQAGEQRVGTGGPTGNYFAMGNDIVRYCAPAVSDSLVIENSSGSLENLNGMINKQFSMVMTQEDVLQYMAKQDPQRVNQNRMKIISGLHAETVHLLLPVGYTPENDSGMFGINFGDIMSKLGAGTGPVEVSVDLLNGQTFGSWGGGLVSARALNYFLDLQANVIEVPEAERTAPKIPVLIVGGQPYKPVQDLLATGNYHLVSLDYNQISTRAPFYTKVSANYMVGGKVETVNTIGVRALLLGVSFRDAERNKVMTDLVTCIRENLGDLADDFDSNPNWGSVYDYEIKEGAQTNWSYF